MAAGDKLFGAFALLIGFVAFSLPLLFHDTKHLWREKRAEDVSPPLPTYKPYPPYQEEDPSSASFRQAVQSGDIKEAESLVAQHGAELVSKEHWHGNTPIFEAARAGQLEMVKWLIKRGAAVDEPNEWGDSAINEAASMNHFDVVWYLADQGANVSRTQPHGHNGLLLSAVRRSTPCATQRPCNGQARPRTHVQWPAHRCATGPPTR